MADLYGISFRPREAAEALALAMKITEGTNNHTVTAEFFSNLLKYEFKLQTASGLEDHFIQYTAANFADFALKAGPIIHSQSQEVRNYFNQVRSLLSDPNYLIVDSKLKVLKQFLDHHQLSEMDKKGYKMVGAGLGGIAIYQKK